MNIFFNIFLSLFGACIVTYIAYSNSENSEHNNMLNNNTYPIFIFTFLFLFFILIGSSNISSMTGGSGDELESGLHSALKHVSYEIPPF